MNCPYHHDLHNFVVPCIQCKTFEKKLMMLGPRTEKEYLSLLKIHRIKNDVKFSFVTKRDNVCEHVVYTFAKKIFLEKGNPVNVFSCFPNDPAHALWILRNANEKLSNYIQVIGRSTVKAKSPLGIYNKDSLENKILSNGIKGTRVDIIVGEYDKAFCDLETLVAEKKIVTTTTHVWHNQNLTLEN